MFPNASFRNLPDQVKWRAVSVAKGESLEGIIAGALVVVETHWRGGRSVPCRIPLCGGRLKCACEDEPMASRILGYCPIITKYRERFVVMLSATVAQKIATIKPGTPVRFGRPAKGLRPLTVSLLTDDDIGSTFASKMRHACCHDIHEYLLHLWQDREMTEHFGQEYIPACAKPEGSEGERGGEGKQIPA